MNRVFIVLLLFLSCKEDKFEGHKLFVDGSQLLLEGQDFSSKQFPIDEGLFYATEVGHSSIVELKTKDFKSIKWSVNGNFIEATSNKIDYNWNEEGEFTIGIKIDELDPLYAFIKVQAKPQEELADDSDKNHFTDNERSSAPEDNNNNKSPKKEFQPKGSDPNIMTNETYSTTYEPAKTNPNAYNPQIEVKKNDINPSTRNNIENEHNNESGSEQVENDIFNFDPPTPSNKTPIIEKPKVLPKTNTGKIGYELKDRCTGEKAYLSEGTEVTLNPKVDLELSYFKLIAKNTGSVDVTIVNDFNSDEKYKFSNRTLLENVPTEINLQSKDITLKAGTTYKIKISPNNGTLLEQADHCSFLDDPSNAQISLQNEFGKGVVFDLKYRY